MTEENAFPWEDTVAGTGEQPPVAGEQPFVDDAQLGLDADFASAGPLADIPLPFAGEQETAEEFETEEREANVAFAEEVGSPMSDEAAIRLSADEALAGAAFTAEPAPPARERESRGRIARKEYYSIGEVSELVGLPAHVLRYWESQFPVLNPSKNRSGNRAYQRKEIRLILLVKQLLYEDKYTVEGAKSKLEQLRKGGGLAGASSVALEHELIGLLRQDITALRQVLAGPRA